MEPRGYIPPSQYDVQLSDEKHDDLVGPISQRLGIRYLELKMIITIVDGVLYGTNWCPMVIQANGSKNKSMLYF